MFNMSSQPARTGQNGTRAVCEECGRVLLTNFADRDKMLYVYCRTCGLIQDPTHKMGRSMKSLMRYAKRKDISLPNQRSIQQAYDAFGLRSARILVANVLNDKPLLSVRASPPEPESTKNEYDILPECPICKGIGWIESTEVMGSRKRCATCNGSGQVEDYDADVWAAI